MADDQSSSNENLLKSIRKKDLSNSVNLLAHGANPDAQDAESGDAAIHIAIRTHNATFVKLLIVFFADLQIKTRDGQTPLELAESEGKKAKDCFTALKTVLDLQLPFAETPAREGTAKAKPGPDDDDVYVLTMDGGGIRGLAFVQVLLVAERRRKQLYPDSFSVLEYFNWLGGTSTGAIAALAFAAQGKTLEEGRMLYLDLKEDVLGARHFPFAEKTVNDVYQRLFGTTATMRSIKGRNVAVMTTIGTMAPPKLHIMSNYGEARDGQKGPDERLIWEAARATSAAVPFFQPFEGILDGGFIANNPTIDTLVDVMRAREKVNAKLNLKAVLSLGCGFLEPTEIEMNHFHRSITETIFGADRPHMNVSTKVVSIDAAIGWSMAKNPASTKALMELMLKQLTQTCDAVHYRGKYLAKALGAQFYRIDPPTDMIEFTESNDPPLIDMMYSAMIGALKSIDKIDKMLDVVVGGKEASS